MIRNMLAGKTDVVKVGTPASTSSPHVYDDDAGAWSPPKAGGAVAPAQALKGYHPSLLQDSFRSG
jgi:hypothetical protein